MNKIYAVGCMKLDTSENAKKYILQERLWFFFAKFEEAEECVLQNHSDIFECDFTHALIEEILVINKDLPFIEGESASYPPREWWYQANYSALPYDADEIRNPIITKVDKPKCFSQTCCFWAG